MRRQNEIYKGFYAGLCIRSYFFSFDVHINLYASIINFLRSIEMTDIEKKAEEYVKEEGFGATWNDITAFEANTEIEKAYKDGYEQGQKDKHQTVCDGCADYGMLQKENAELKKKVEILKKDLELVERFSVMNP